MYLKKNYTRREFGFLEYSVLVGNLLKYMRKCVAGGTEYQIQGNVC